MWVMILPTSDRAVLFQALDDIIAIHLPASTPKVGGRAKTPYI